MYLNVSCLVYHPRKCLDFKVLTSLICSTTTFRRPRNTYISLKGCWIQPNTFILKFKIYITGYILAVPQCTLAWDNIYDCFFPVYIVSIWMWLTACWSYLKEWIWTFWYHLGYCTSAAFMQGCYSSWMSYFSLEVHVHTVHTYCTYCTDVLGPHQSLICLKAKRRRTFSPWRGFLKWAQG